MSEREYLRKLPTSPVDKRRTTETRDVNAKLVAILTPDASVLGASWDLDATTALEVGRNPRRGGIEVLDLQMSRAHWRIAFDAASGWFQLSDLDSRNGTYLDGEPIREAELGERNVIRAGETVFVFVTGRLPEFHQERSRQLARTHLPVLIGGETGTGKEVLANLIHRESGRLGPFVAVNCAALPKDLVASELFGHVKGAFSGAALDRKGLFRAADGGTLFLDEIGDMPLETQPSLLRALQEGTIKPVGSDRELKVDVRVLAATHTDLRCKIEQGTFRQDLYARLARSTIVLRPLRERPLELLPLATQFAAEYQRKLTVTADAAEALLGGRWPLNIRELQALIQLFCLTEPDGKALDLDFLYEHKRDLFEREETRERATEPPDAPPPVSEDSVRRALEVGGGNVSAAAKALNIPRATFYRRMKALGIEPHFFRD